MYGAGQCRSANRAAGERLSVVRSTIRSTQNAIEIVPWSANAVSGSSRSSMSEACICVSQHDSDLKPLVLSDDSKGGVFGPKAPGEREGAKLKFELPQIYGSGIIPSS